MCEVFAKPDCFRSYVKGIQRTTVSVRTYLDTITPRAVGKGSHQGCPPPAVSQVFVIFCKGRYLGQMCPHPPGGGRGMEKIRRNQKDREDIGLFYCLALKNREKIGKWVGKNIEILGQNILPFIYCDSGPCLQCF